MSNRFIRQKVVDIVGQCGLPITPRREIISETGGLGFKLPRCGVPGRYSQPLPLRSVYRITHIPPPPPTDAAQVYVCQNLDDLENSKLDFSYHPTMHINSSVTVFRPRLPILCIKEPLQDKIYQPSTFEEKDLVELPSEAVKARTLRSRTHRLNDQRPKTARNLSKTLLSPLEIHEPNFPSPSLMARTHCKSARAERPNSNTSDYQESSPRSISMKKLEAPPISEDLIPKEIDPEEVSKYEESLYYIEDKSDTEEVKEPPNRRLQMIHRLLKGYLRRDKDSDLEEEEDIENENLSQNEIQNQRDDENQPENDFNQEAEEHNENTETQQDDAFQSLIQDSTKNLTVNQGQDENILETEKEHEMNEPNSTAVEKEITSEAEDQQPSLLQPGIQNAIENLAGNQEQQETQRTEDNSPETENRPEVEKHQDKVESENQQESKLQSALQDTVNNLTDNKQDDIPETDNKQDDTPETDNNHDDIPEADNKQDDIPETENKQENAPELESQQYNTETGNQQENELQSALQGTIMSFAENQQEDIPETKNQQEDTAKIDNSQDDVPETDHQQENALQSTLQNAVGNLTGIQQENEPQETTPIEKEKDNHSENEGQDENALQSAFQNVVGNLT